jgi:hypothetical protein
LVTSEGLKEGGVGMLEERCGFWLGAVGRVPI